MLATTGTRPASISPWIGLGVHGDHVADQADVDLLAVDHAPRRRRR